MPIELAAPKGAGVKKQTIIISDLHLGGGRADPGDDHVYQNSELAGFISELSDGEAGKKGEVELIINGDFLEFVQVKQDAYAYASSKLWCAEAESLLKLECIIAGHRNVFDALGILLSRGNQVTIVAGNHDVDVYWPKVRDRLRYVTGESLSFELGTEWISRYEGRLQISHGHMKDPANTFENWKNPIKTAPTGPERLEMCAGTLFMVKFVTALEVRYPFADNIHPVQNLAKLLINDEKAGFFAISWSLLKFAGQHPIAMSNDNFDSYGHLLLSKIAKNQNFAEALHAIVKESQSHEYANVADFRSKVRSESELAMFILRYWVEIEAAGLSKQFEPGSTNTLGLAGKNSLGLIKSSGDFGKKALRKIAENHAKNVDHVQVIVMGHTHIWDEFQIAKNVIYLNPGSWTRFVDLNLFPGLSLDDLRDETRFPYSLRYVQIETNGKSQLVATLKIFKEQAAVF